MFTNILRNRSNGDSGPVLEVAIDIPVVSVPWLWIDWLARGKLHLLAGPLRRARQRWPWRSPRH